MAAAAAAKPAVPMFGSSPAPTGAAGVGSASKGIFGAIGGALNKVFGGQEAKKVCCTARAFLAGKRSFPLRLGSPSTENAGCVAAPGGSFMPPKALWDAGTGRGCASIATFVGGSRWLRLLTLYPQVDDEASNSIQIQMEKNSDDSDDEEEGERKLPPAWARSPLLRAQIDRQADMSPTPIFGECKKTCDLGTPSTPLRPSETRTRTMHTAVTWRVVSIQASQRSQSMPLESNSLPSLNPSGHIFQNHVPKRRKYDKRTSSADWSEDGRASFMEEDRFQRQMIQNMAMQHQSKSMRM